MYLNRNGTIFMLFNLLTFATLGNTTTTGLTNGTTTPTSGTSSGSSTTPITGSSDAASTPSTSSSKPSSTPSTKATGSPASSIAVSFVVNSAVLSIFVQ